MKRFFAFVLCFMLINSSAHALPYKQIEAASSAIAAVGRQPDIWKYNYAKPVPESPKYTDEVFKNALFIGNSLADGFRAFSGIGQGSHSTAVGMSVYSAAGKLSAAAGKDRVYIMLGINEIGHGADEVAAKYGEILDKLRALAPEAEIYVQSVLPVHEDSLTSAQKSYGISNANILALNRALQDLCAQKQVYYLDIHSALIDENGALPRDHTWDGVHLTPEAYGIWLRYLRNHIAP